MGTRQRIRRSVSLKGLLMNPSGWTYLARRKVSSSQNEVGKITDVGGAIPQPPGWFPEAAEDGRHTGFVHAGVWGLNP